jgi:formylglycine-generating enzyme required for sulfatase activity
MKIVLKPKLKLKHFIKIKAGLYEMYQESTFALIMNCKHKVYVNDFEISNKLVTNQEYLDFITAGGYQNFNFGMMKDGVGSIRII